MRIAVFLPNWIGDVVMATPALRALHHEFGENAELVGVMKPYVADVLRGTPWLQHSVMFDPGSKDANLRYRAMAQQLRAMSVQVSVLMRNSWSCALAGWLSGASRRIGFARTGHQWMLTERLFEPRRGRQRLPRPAVQHYLELAWAMGCRETSHQVELATTPEDEAAADRVWRRLGLQDGQKVILLNGGAARASSRDWPAEYFSQLAQRIACEQQVPVLVNCGPKERESAASVANQAAHPLVHSLADPRLALDDAQLSIGLTKACVRRSRVMVSTDSGPRHFAAAFQIPSVLLSGPIDPRWSANFHPQETTLTVPLECRPCARSVCPLGHHRCMRDLHVDQVHRAVRQHLHHTGTKAA